MRGSVWFLLAGVVLLPGRQAAAQRFAVDAEPVGGSVSLAWAVSPVSALGFAAGFTPYPINVTLYPSGEEFEEFLHLGAFWRRYAGAFEGDLGLRLSIAELYECTASDCWPGLFAGGYAALFIGWEHVKVGSRLQVGTFDESGGPRTGVVHITPLLLRISF